MCLKDEWHIDGVGRMHGCMTDGHPQWHVETQSLRIEQQIYLMTHGKENESCDTAKQLDSLQKDPLGQLTIDWPSQKGRGTVIQQTEPDW